MDKYSSRNAGDKQQKWLHRRRLTAMEALEKLQTPSSSTPGWKNVPIKKMSIQNQKYLTCPNMVTQNILENDQEYSVRVDIDEVTFKFYSADDGISESVIVENIAEIKNIPEKFFNQVFPSISNIYLANSILHGTNGFAVYVKPNRNINKPILININAGEKKTIEAISCYIFAGSESNSKIILNWGSSSTDNQHPILANGIVILQNGAVLDLIDNQNLNYNSWMYSNIQSWLHQSSVLNYTSIQKGGNVSKYDFLLNMNGQNSNAFITGLYRAERDQVFNFDTRQNHSANNSKSNLLYQGILKGSSHVVWQGMVEVQKETRGVDGFQAHRALLLDDGVHCVSLPGLEISTDDVRCSHAVAAGSLDEEQIFYLKARGIPTDKAEEMILDGYFESALERLPSSEFKKLSRETLLLKTD